jgi:hypothetical protein
MTWNMALDAAMDSRLRGNDENRGCAENVKKKNPGHFRKPGFYLLVAQRLWRVALAQVA